MFGRLAHMCSPLHRHASPVKRLLVINGHSDPGAGRYCAALCAAYAESAQASGYTTERLDVGAVTAAGAESGQAGWRQYRDTETVERLWLADRLFIAFPMWLGGYPPALRLLLEDFTRWQDAEAAQCGGLVEAKEAHIVVTADYPALVYRTNRGVPLGEWAAALSGLCITQSILIGNMASLSPKDRDRWLIEVRRLGSTLLDGMPGKAVQGCSR